MQSPDGSDSINDINFLPYSSTIFASASAEGRIDVWDIYKNVINPLITEFSGVNIKNDENTNTKPQKQKSLIKILFGLNNPILLTGNNDGVVTVYRVNGLETEFTKKEHVERLQKGIHPE